MLTSYVAFQKSRFSDPLLADFALRLVDGGIATNARIGRCMAIGALVTLWAMGDDHADKDGKLRLSRAALDEAFGFDVLSFIPQEWLRRISRAAVVLPRFWTKNGKPARERLRDADRKRQGRAEEATPEVTSKVRRLPPPADAVEIAKRNEAARRQSDERQRELDLTMLLPDADPPPIIIPWLTAAELHGEFELDSVSDPAEKQLLALCAASELFRTSDPSRSDRADHSQNEPAAQRENSPSERCARPGNVAHAEDQEPRTAAERVTCFLAAFPARAGGFNREATSRALEVIRARDRCAWPRVMHAARGYCAYIVTTGQARTIYVKSPDAFLREGRWQQQDWPALETDEEKQQRSVENIRRMLRANGTL